MAGTEKEKLFEWLKDLKSVHRVTYASMAKALGYTPEGISKGIKTETLSLSQAQKIAEYTGFSDEFHEYFRTKTNKKTPSEEMRFEDIVAKKVIDGLKPYFQDLKDEINRVGGNIELDNLEIKNKQEELNSMQKKTQDSIENLL